MPAMTIERHDPTCQTTLLQWKRPVLWLVNVALLILALGIWIGAAWVKTRPQPKIDMAKLFWQGLAEATRIRADGSQEPLLPRVNGKVADAQTNRMIDLRDAAVFEAIIFDFNVSAGTAKAQPMPDGWTVAGEITGNDPSRTVTIYRTPEGGVGYGRGGCFSKSQSGRDSQLAAFVMTGVTK